MTTNPDPERIWLAPVCCDDPHTGRHWAPDPSPWPCQDCLLGAEGVEYVRADLLSSVSESQVKDQEHLKAITAACEALEKACLEAEGAGLKVEIGVACISIRVFRMVTEGKKRTFGFRPVVTRSLEASH